MRRRGIVGITATMVVSLMALPLAPASAASDVIVHGTDLPMGVQLSFVGCQSLFDRAPETLHPYVGLGPATPPLGDRSLGYDLGGGDAVGSLAFVPNVGSAAPTSISVYADRGTTGVAYAGYSAPAQRGTGRMWIGRAPLAVPAGQWTTIQTEGLTYTWTQVVVATGKTVGTTKPTATARAFTASQHGDGPGFLTLGFGCDGAPFDLDAMHVGGTTYDFEGLAVSAGISASAQQIPHGTSVTLTGSLRDSAGGFVPQGTLTLEARPANGDWHAVQVVDASASDPSVTLRPGVTTEYRFTSPERQLANATESAPVTVTVTPNAKPSPSGSPSPSASPSHSPSPTASPTATSPKPSSTPKPKPTPKASPTTKASPTSKPTPKPTPKPTASASPKSSPSATSAAPSASR